MIALVNAYLCWLRDCTHKQGSKKIMYDIERDIEGGITLDIVEGSTVERGICARGFVDLILAIGAVHQDMTTDFGYAQVECCFEDHVHLELIGGLIN